MKNRFFIAVMVLALVAVPCAKIVSAYAGAVAQAGASYAGVLEALIEGRDFSHVDRLAVEEDGDTTPVCHKSCKTWQGVVPRPDDVAAHGAKTQVVVDVLSHEVVLPNHGVERLVSRARAPPEPAGPVFTAFYARTSRFLS